MFVVGALVVCSGVTLILYNPDWLELLFGVVPQELSYPEWVEQKYPGIAKHSVWVETTRYVGVIGGAGFDYLAYTAWLREKSWGVLPEKASDEKLAEIAADPNHEVRKWINAPIVDCAISFLLIVAFSAVFVASGAMILGPEQVVPNEDNLLNLQAKFVTNIHPLLLPLYVTGAFLTMLGTLYGTIEIACSIADEIVRSFAPVWTTEPARKLKRGVIAWCASFAVIVLVWLFIRQASFEPPETVADSTNVAATGDQSQAKESARLKKPRLLLAILTPVNLFTGVLACGLICLLAIWMDRRWLPKELQPPKWLVALNIVSAIVFAGLGLKGYWDNEDRMIVAIAMPTVLLIAMLLASIFRKRLMPADSSQD